MTIRKYEKFLFTTISYSSGFCSVGSAASGTISSSCSMGITITGERCSNGNYAKGYIDCHYGSNINESAYNSCEEGGDTSMVTNCDPTGSGK